MQDALLERTVAEEADRNRAGVLEFGGQRRARCQAHPAADDAVRAEHVLVHVGDVHAAALAAGVAGGTPEQLGHHAVDVAALGDGVAVTAVRAGDVVVRAQRRGDADADRLHADVRMGGATHLARAIERQCVLLERADGHHQAQRLFETLAAQH